MYFLVCDPGMNSLNKNMNIPGPSKGCQMVPLQGVNSPSLRV